MGELDRVGVGRWTARTLVRAHGGDLGLADSVRGATFAFVWPAVLGHLDSWSAEKEEFARAVRQSREASGMTIAQLSRSTGISDDTLSKLEHGKHRANRRTRAWLLKVLLDRREAAEALKTRLSEPARTLIEKTVGKSLDEYRVFAIPRR